MAAISRSVNRALARTAAISKASVQSSKSLSTLSSFPFDKVDNDYAVRIILNIISWKLYDWSL